MPVLPTTRSNRLLVGIPVALIAAVAAVLISISGSGQEAIANPDSVGTAAPETNFQYFDGSAGSLDDFAGKPVVLNFWASWCPACVAEMPDFQAVHQQLGDDVVFLGLDMQDVSREAALGLIASTGVDYVLADDPDGEIFRTFGGFSMPTTVFINEAGEIVGRHNGTIFADDLTATINELLLNG